MVAKFIGTNGEAEKFYVFDVTAEERPWAAFSVEIPFPGNRRQVGRYSKTVLKLPREEKKSVLASVRGYMDAHDLKYSKCFYDFER